MGLLDQLVKGVAGKLLGGSSGAKNPLLDMAMKMLTDPKTGGLEGLVETFKNKGLNEVMSSWISTGQNQPISGNQIQDILGSGLIQQFAKKMGGSNENVSGQLASLLPDLINKLTPNGQVPNASTLKQSLKMLKKGSL